MVTSTFYGVGVGPGDEKLLTLKAVEAIQKATAIFVPMKKDGSPGLAYQIARNFINPETPIIPLRFPMIQISSNISGLQSFWEENARLIGDTLKKGDVIFLTLGDPFLYSTYAYVLEYLKKCSPKTKVETIPGINAFSALASRLGVSLVQGEESLVICSMTSPNDKLQNIFSEFDNIIVMKASGNTSLLTRLIKENNLEEHFVLLSNVGFDDEKISRNLEDLDCLPYLSTVLIKKNFNFNNGSL